MPKPQPHNPPFVLVTELKSLVDNLPPEIILAANASLAQKENAPPLPPKVGAESLPNSSPSIANGTSNESTPTPSPNQVKIHWLILKSCQTKISFMLLGRDRNVVGVGH